MPLPHSSLRRAAVSFSLTLAVLGAAPASATATGPATAPVTGSPEATSERTTAPLLNPPVEPFTVTHLASLPQHDWLPGHRGIDLVASVGEPVGAPGAGEVSFVGIVVDRPIVSVRHQGGFVSSFEPVDPTVAVGDAVETGTPIGTVAAAPGHCAPDTCVHWGLRRDGRYVDPLDYVRGFGRIQLLPLAGAG
ncbi:M23 family metallopeptidase [Demequina sp. TTPB684]|uniref:M23 family metallopeptidase n=1 Tax=unclassified Demequina TaxID=2620311 RepID=UPI001CF19FBD|nr:MULTISPECIES: M23 family metallopeptidase [unclassified Demequina]MCB2412157.1 M23 family metallopeptidase [Demequina sp. TTPB684]UPU89650.1 M23 family metallopeptidase [Demequina sp. TMPB413]